MGDPCGFRIKLWRSLRRISAIVCDDDSHTITHESRERSHEEDHVEQKQEQDIRRSVGKGGGGAGRLILEFRDLMEADFDLL